jgi:hypothetical protein
MQDSSVSAAVAGDMSPAKLKTINAEIRGVVKIFRVRLFIIQSPPVQLTSSRRMFHFAIKAVPSSPLALLIISGYIWNFNFDDGDTLQILFIQNRGKIFCQINPLGCSTYQEIYADLQ